MKESVSNTIREYRKKYHMTQAELAERSGVSRQSIISIEKGHYIPSLPLALKFSEVFQCPVKDLFKLNSP